MLLNLDDLYYARVVCLGPDGVYASYDPLDAVGAVATDPGIHPVDPGSDDVGLFLLR